MEKNVMRFHGILASMWSWTYDTILKHFHAIFTFPFTDDECKIHTC